jgi:hypothetical protein
MRTQQNKIFQSQSPLKKLDRETCLIPETIATALREGRQEEMNRALQRCADRSIFAHGLQISGLSPIVGLDQYFFSFCITSFA